LLGIEKEIKMKIIYPKQAAGGSAKQTGSN
jgi:hypothetical protein